MSNKNTLSIKDPEALIITIVPIIASAGADVNVTNIVGRASGAIGVNASIPSTGETITLRGVFANDGDFARLEPTGDDEDTYTETADGSACVQTNSRRNEKLTIRINGCNDYVERLVAMKKKKQTLMISVLDISSNFKLTSNCAYMLTNPPRSFGISDEIQELSFLLTDITDNQASITNSLSVYAEASGILIA
jgi:hypothetical protein